MTDQIDRSIETHAPSIIQIDSGKLVPMLMVLSVLCGGAIVAAWTARDRAFDAETQSLLLRSHVDELRMAMERAGVSIPPIPKELNTPR